MIKIFKTKIDVETYKKELEQKIINNDITKQDIENHLITIKYLKYLRKDSLYAIFKILFLFLFLFLILRGWPLLIAACAIVLLVFSCISEFQFYNKNVKYFYTLNDLMNNIVNKNKS